MDDESETQSSSRDGAQAREARQAQSCIWGYPECNKETLTTIHKDIRDRINEYPGVEEYKIRAYNVANDFCGTHALIYFEREMDIITDDEHYHKSAVENFIMLSKIFPMYIPMNSESQEIVQNLDDKVNNMTDAIIELHSPHPIDNIKLVIKHSGCFDLNKVINAMNLHHGDIVDAIMELTF
jgi:NACalpha-BTF3-like transcription factor